MSFNNDHGKTDSPGSGSRFSFWVVFIVIILMSLLAVPFFVMGVALKKTAWETFHRVAKTVATKPSEPQSTNAESVSDLTSLRATVEKAASQALPVPEVFKNKLGLQIQVEPPATLETAATVVHDVLRQNHHQFVEAYDNDKIRIIVIIQSKDWAHLAQLLGVATDKVGFDYRGPNQTSTATNSAESMVAEIEILRKK